MEIQGVPVQCHPRTQEIGPYSRITNLLTIIIPRKRASLKGVYTLGFPSIFCWILSCMVVGYLGHHVAEGSWHLRSSSSKSLTLGCWLFNSSLMTKVFPVFFLRLWGWNPGSGVETEKWLKHPIFWRFFFPQTAECFGVFAQYRFRCVLGELGRFREETGFRTRGIVPGSEGCEPEVSKVSVFDGFRGVYIESMILYFERLFLYFESKLLYFERILL